MMVIEFYFMILGMMDLIVDRDNSMEDINVYHELTHEQCNQKAEAEQYVVYNKMEKLTQSEIYFLFCDLTTC